MLTVASYHKHLNRYNPIKGSFIKYHMIVSHLDIRMWRDTVLVHAVLVVLMHIYYNMVIKGYTLPFGMLAGRKKVSY